ncbi:ImmA/IrrE family metallo-endopeptidase [Paenibacillus arenosi]|uniref:ImmA/IrrE family metallo-endopeptidase n=1 Tax=Paenibacillus arenosi TaxID=2774142 RepID=A0ABR9B5D6_9BACL|nr:ImmA/IrrE family metallo-endopeptidase [Paenibacillus arenosi]MBD8501094.1 ImmA/IrrE family metallo-endopeptidase [Paenibacillus arenosi]
MSYEQLLKEAAQQKVDTYEMPMTLRNKGFYSDKVIWINKHISTNIEKACILAEELGHYYTSSGDITNQSVLCNRKQEKRARNWGYNRLISLDMIVDAHKHGIRNRYELANYMGVTEDFLDSTLLHFQEKYGSSVTVGKYTICFEPLGVLEWFE